jgi:hypothetical protein
MMRLSLVFLLALALAPGCKDGGDNTKIVVAVWSDLSVPAELDSVRIDAVGPTGESYKTFPVVTATALPLQLELVPLAAKDATFTVTAVGQKATAALVSQSARVSFVSGQSLLLKMFLGRACESNPCAGDTTCSAGTCRPVDVPNLPPYEPNKPLLGPDAGVPGDSGADGDTLDTSDAETSEAASPDLRTPDTGIGDGQRTEVPIPTGGAGGSAGASGSDGQVDLGGDIAVSASGGDAGPGGISGADGQGSGGVSGGRDGALPTAFDGGEGIDGGRATDGLPSAIDGGIGTCILPSCMSNGAQTCAPSGTCVAQTVAPTTNTCYQNHVKVVQQGVLTDPSGMTVTFKNDSGTCFSLNLDVTSAMGWLAGKTLIIPVKDAAGAQAGTLSVDPTTMQITAVCRGAQPAVLHQACGSLLGFMPGSAANSCTSGSCTP